MTRCPYVAHDSTGGDCRCILPKGHTVACVYEEPEASAIADEAEVHRELERRLIEAEHKLTAIRTILENYDPYETDYAFHVVRAIEELKP